MLDALVEPYQE